MNIINNPIPFDKTWSRQSLIEILNAALSTGENRFAYQTALQWLSSYPGDLPVNLIRAKALNSDGLDRQALPILKNLVEVDPEYFYAQTLLSQIISDQDNEDGKTSYGCSVALGNYVEKNHQKTPNSLSWYHLLAKARNAFSQGNFDYAGKQIQKVLSLTPHTPIGDITHLQIIRSQDNIPISSLQNLADHYHQKWPECIQFMLILAETLKIGAEPERSVALLHMAASKDVTGQVATRLWGPDHPYRNLWPRKLNAIISTQIPANVKAILGWNLLSQPVLISEIPGVKENESETKNKETIPPMQDNLQAADKFVTPEHTIPDPGSQNIPASTLSSPENIDEEPGDTSNAKEHRPEILKSIHIDKDKKQPLPRRGDRPNAKGRFPVYVIFTTKKGMNKKFGEKTTAVLDQSMRKLVSAIRKRLNWGSILIYADDPASMAQFGMKPVSSEDPWKLKLALVDLDAALGKRGARIGALLIIGGAEIVPFHYLPNPTDDADINVPSDNPYATRDENYFIPEWPVGRLPGGAGNDPGLLISTLRTMTDRHSKMESRQKNRFSVIFKWLLQMIRSRGDQSQSSFGYTAEAWQQASSSVFRPIGDPRTLITSPPVEINARSPLPTTKLGYFNLHGVADSAEWFGQRDPRNGEAGPDYPIAIHPKDVVNGGRSPQVIFSEACYGANIHKKSIEEALALKFLASGSQAIIGSTVISYGSVTSPLNAADLLGHSFWKSFKEGFTTGESLRRAKINLAAEMHRRQGYLDGEDQKTLISFVLYGDPLAQERDLQDWKLRKTIPGTISLPDEIITVCDRVDVPGTSEPIPDAVVAKVKKIVDQYLPGLRDAQLSLSHEHNSCTNKGHTCPTSQLGQKSKKHNINEHLVVTLSKQVVRSRHTHDYYARLTLDQNGKVVKLAVSR